MRPFRNALWPLAAALLSTPVACSPTHSDSLGEAPSVAPPAADRGARDPTDSARGSEEAASPDPAVDPAEEPGVEVPVDPIPADPDAELPPAEEPPAGEPEPLLPNAELLVKIIGVPGALGGHSHQAVDSSVVPIVGIVLGGAESVSWTSSTGEAGAASGAPFFATTPVSLAPGSNAITISASKGSQVATDTITLVHNPSFHLARRPVVVPDALFAGEPTKARVTVDASFASPFAAGGLRVWRVGGAVEPLGAAPLATLQDDGDLSGCDEISGDRVFSACLGSLSCAAGEDWLIAASFDHAGGTAWSAPARVECVARVSAAVCTAARTALTDGRAAWTSAGGATDPGTGRDAAIAALLEDPAVASAGPATHDGFGVWVRFHAGFLGGINLAPPGFRGGPALVARALRSTAAAPVPSTVPGSRRALLVGPWETGDVAAQLAQAQCPPFEIDGPFEGAEAGLAALRGQARYGLIALTGHGEALFAELDPETKAALGFEHAGSQEVLWTSEPVACGALAAASPSCTSDASCPGGSECAITGISAGTPTGICVDHTQADLRRGRIVLSDETWGITAGFVSRHAGGPLPSPMVYLGACRTMFVGTFAAEYLAVGAAAVAGYGEYVTSGFAHATATSFFDALIVQRASSGAALFAADGEDPDSPGGRLRLLGAANLDLLADGLLNPGFEAGRPRGWRVEGDGRVVGKLASIGAPEGKYMGVVSTGLGYTVTTGQLTQAICVPDHIDSLRFRWRLCSEEFVEWCGTVFQDAFEASLVADAGEIALVDVQIDDLCHYDDGWCAPCPDPEAGCQCGSQYVGLDGVPFGFCEEADVYCTPWQEVDADITPLAGEGPVELRLFTTDIGDSIYDTVVLLDGFELN